MSVKFRARLGGTKGRMSGQFTDTGRPLVGKSNGFRKHVYTRRFIRSKDPGHCLLLPLDSLVMTTTLVLNLLGTLLFCS